MLERKKENACLEAREERKKEGKRACGGKDMGCWDYLVLADDALFGAEADERCFEVGKLVSVEELAHADHLGPEQQSLSTGKCKENARRKKRGATFSVLSQ